jgi:predicted Zn-dependent protease
MQTEAKRIGAAGLAPEPDNHHDPVEELQWGEWLYGELVAYFDMETEPWAVDLVHRAAARLNRERAPAPAMEPVVLWMTTLTAFTGPGRYLYLSRELLHRAHSEECVGFTIAHEMAHHDLGHTQLYRGKLALVRHLPGSLMVAAVLSMADHWLNGPENEATADAHAIDLCLAAGYDGARCLELFDLFEAYALDHGAIECVFGPEEDPHPLAGDHPDWRAAARSWVWRHRHGYPAIRARKEALRARLGAQEPARGWSH